MRESKEPQSSPNSDRHELLRADRFWIERIGYEDLQGARRWKDVVRHPGAAVIVPVLEGGRVCLIRNRRVTVGETLLEVPAGTLDPDEPPEQCARRELEEETGYVAGEMTSLGWFYVSPGILDERMHLFAATGLRLSSPNRMPDESIENEIVTYEQSLAMIESGEIHDAKTIVALLRIRNRFNLPSSH